jgi:molybdopterin converting factor small subunit
MHVTVHYLAQFKRAAGCSSEDIETPPGMLRDFLRLLADRHDSAFRALLLDDDGEPRKANLFFVGDEHAELSRLLNDGDTITILAPMSGG